MKRRSMAAAVLAAVATFALAGSTLAAGAFQNGSFEQGTFVNNGFGYETLAVGTANAGAMTGWTVTAGSVDWIGTFWKAEDGSMSLDMNGSPTVGVSTTVGAVAQTFATLPNHAYTVSFYLAGNPGSCAGAPATKTLWVTATGTAAASYSFTNSATTTLANMGWTQETYQFTATSNTTTLTFAADPGNTSGCGPALDNVSVSAGIAGTGTGSGAQCKKGGWKSMTDNSGNPFKNQGACVSFYARSGAVPIGR